MSTEDSGVIIGFLVAAVIAFMLGMILGANAASNGLRAQSVERGHARWMSIQGEREFVWFKKGDTEPDIRIEPAKGE